MLDSPQNPVCHACGKDLGLRPGNIGRSEECPHCSADVRVCLNCRHYDTAAYNECNEPMAERVVDKTKRNFCDYFSLTGGNTKSAAQEKADALKKLDELFKK